MSAEDSTLAGRIIAWQRQHGRHSLPWQQTRDPYRVWLSEIMLQQTQVSTVLGYYERFLQRFPTVADLAAAPLDDVLALWAGLGYYSRARNLHRCAQAVVELHGGRFPAQSTALTELPGIGRSTAAAIAAFCFGERVAILDGNVKRVLSRALAFEEDLAQARNERSLWNLATELLPAGPGIEAYTQGLMDLGASLCSTRKPGCDQCPLSEICQAAQRGEPERYPVRVKKLKRKSRNLFLVWLSHQDAVWLVQRPVEGGIWAGLWSLPEFESPAELRAAFGSEPLVELPAAKPFTQKAVSPSALPADLSYPQSAQSALPLGEPDAIWNVEQVSQRPTWQELPAFAHVLTHLDLQLHPVRVRWPDASEPGLPKTISQAGSGRWVKYQDLVDYGLPAPIRKLLAGGAT